MKKIFYLTAALCIAALFGACAGSGTQSESAKPAIGKERKVAVQTFTMRKHTLEESLPILKSIGVNALGCSAGQKISKKYPVAINPKLTKEQREFVRKLLADNGFVIASYGVYNPKDDADIRALFELCRDIGAPTIITEASANQLPLMNELAKKYNIRVCIHNHAKDSKRNNYYDPNVVWNMIKDYDMIYACADNGHWSRSGIRTIDGYRALHNKIDVIHFKDQKKFGNIKNENVPLGSGELGIKEVLAYLDSIGYDGYFVIENENIADNPLPDMKKSVDFLRTH